MNLPGLEHTPPMIFDWMVDALPMSCIGLRISMVKGPNYKQPHFNIFAEFFEIFGAFFVSEQNS
jgi:hypothetical protein